MTQKFHENETATIALYKYHALLDCEQKLADINKLCHSDEILDMKVRFCKGEVGKTRPIAQEFQTLYDLLLSMKF